MERIFQVDLGLSSSQVSLMPITPYHFGPGVALKALIPRYFSFTVFCFAQVATDAEVVFYLLRDDFPIHRHFHTYVGATGVGLFCALAGKPLCELGLRLWNGWRQAPFKRFVDRHFDTTGSIPWKSAFVAAFLGTYSHVLLDSFMHDDMEPLSPLRPGNPLYGEQGVAGLGVFCVLSGVAGACALARRKRGDLRR